MNRTRASGPPCSGCGTPYTGGVAAVLDTVAIPPETILPRRMSDLAERLLNGDKRALARGISLVEDDVPEGWDLVKAVYPKTGNASVVGFTGPPGAGKSTLIGALIRVQREAERQVAVLSIDPSSPFRGGALLGDRIRLTEHFLDPGVFIRSMATRGALGGLAEASLQAALLMDAAGKDDVFLETVGVGQTEASRGEGVRELAEKLREHRAYVEAEGTLSERRRRNLMAEVLGIATVRLRQALEASLHEDAEVQELLDAVVARKLDPASAANAILARGAVDPSAAAREA